jgi:two-component system sensor histidine kinase BaeS
MLNTLRQRLILSHVLPLLIVIPVMGIALIYVLETRVLLQNLATELRGHAALVAELARDQPSIWTSPQQADVFVNEMSQDLAARIELVDSKGRLLASSDPLEKGQVGQSLAVTPDGALSGQVVARTSYSRQLHAEVADIWVPVLGSNHQVLGIVRLSHRFASVQQQFLQMRYLILGVLAVGLILGTATGWLLALNMERPLRQVTQAIYQLASGGQQTPLPEEGPEELRLLSRAVNTLVARLNGLEQARRQLLANLVHELGRPLGALRSATQALLGGADQDSALHQELLVGMEDEIRRLQRLLENLANLHDQVLGSLELARRPIKLSTWLSQTLAPWREAARMKGLHWESAVPGDLPILEADPDRLAGALGNLISNAIKFTPQGGTVSVEANIENEAIRIQVRDTGPGISPQEKDHIFTPFYRGSGAGRFPQGMGLGLSIARAQIIAHGGRLEVESTLGRGTRFTVWMPIAKQSHGLAAPVAESPIKQDAPL